MFRNAPAAFGVLPRAYSRPLAKGQAAARAILRMLGPPPDPACRCCSLGHRRAQAVRDIEADLLAGKRAAANMCRPCLLDMHIRVDPRADLGVDP